VVGGAGGARVEEEAVRRRLSCGGGTVEGARTRRMTDQWSSHKEEDVGHALTLTHDQSCIGVTLLAGEHTWPRRQGMSRH
jgi:hypothetical protein